MAFENAAEWIAEEVKDHKKWALAIVLSLVIVGIVVPVASSTLFHSYRKEAGSGQLKGTESEPPGEQPGPVSLVTRVLDSIVHIKDYIEAFVVIRFLLMGDFKRLKKFFLRHAGHK